MEAICIYAAKPGDALKKALQEKLKEFVEKELKFMQKCKRGVEINE